MIKESVGYWQIVYYNLDCYQQALPLKTYVTVGWSESQIRLCLITGYTGRRCENRLDPCLSAGCVNGHCASFNNGSVQCLCYVGFTGDRWVIYVFLIFIGTDCKHLVMCSHRNELYKWC